MKQERKSLSVSVDELALLFSLINQSDMGKSILHSAYGEIPSQSIEDRLTAASHSLLAKKVTTLSQNKTITMDDSVEVMLSPLIQFKNILQITRNDESSDFGPEIINIYVSKENTYTAIKITLDVVYELFYSDLDDLPALVSKFVELPPSATISDYSATTNQVVDMNLLSTVIVNDAKNIKATLSKAGFPERLRSVFEKDISKVKVRGSVVLTDMNSENYSTKSTDEAGAGFLFLVGEKSNWLFRFDSANEQTKALLAYGTDISVESEISNLTQNL